ncbi:MAG: hypothetical protein AAGA42_21630 [Actinomycetota bacterium]
MAGVAACAAIALVGVSPATAAAAVHDVHIGLVDGAVECRIDESWDLVQAPRFSPPIQCDLNVGDAGSFSIDAATVLAAAVELGANADGGDVMWIEAWGPRDGGYAFTSTRMAHLDATEFVYDQGVGTTALWSIDTAGEVTPLVAAGTTPGAAMARPSSAFDERLPADGPGDTMAAAPTAIDMTAPVEPQPWPSAAGDDGMIRLTFNQGSSQFLYPVIVEFESDDLVDFTANGTYIGTYAPQETPLKVNLAGANWIRLADNRGDQLGLGFELLPIKRFEPGATFGWHGDVESSGFGTISGNAYFRSPTVFASLD